MNIIKSNKYKQVFADFDVLATHGQEPAVMAIMAEPKNGQDFLMPMDPKTALNLGTMLVQTAIKLKPELFAEWLSGE